MSDIEATKVYIRYREDHPESEPQDAARRGFMTFGVEVARFYWVTDIEKMEDLGPTVAVVGYIDDVMHGLTKLGKPHPLNVDYPSELKEFLGRNIVEASLASVRFRPGVRMFVKPVQHKLFSGFVWDGGPESRHRILTVEDHAPVYICEPLTFVSEYRSMILDNEVLDCRRYKGDYGVAPDRKVVEAAVEKMRGHSPRAYCLDWGVTDKGETLLVEMNEGYAFGCYGMYPTFYAKMLSARWHEMVG